MKKKFMMNFWTFSIIFVLTQFFKLNRALSFTFATAPHLHAQVLIKNSYPTIDMKMHIKKILNLDHHRNSTIDEYIATVFNVQNPNPSYVFRLPGSQEIIYRRSDFREAIFPNITNVNKFNQTFDHLQTSASTSNQQALKFTKDISEELKFEKYFLDKMKSLEDSDYDENLRKIVEENVRTERTFMSFIDDLNKDLEEEEFRTNQLKLQSAQKSKTTNNKFKDSDDWDALGLPGWSGSMKEINGKHRTAIESPIQANKPPSFQGSKQPKKVNTKTALINYDNISYLNPPVPPQRSKSKPYNYQQVHQNYNSQENLSDNPEFNNISDQLSVLLHDEEVLLNKTGRTPASKPRWPLTSPREAHGDSDVYLARANNPFGHSTKWKYKNNSTDGVDQQREGRSKRGVVHLYSMIKCATGCDPISYKGYGCYCGFLGNGRALDGIDRCCKMHDYCYTHSKCPMFLEYFVPYLWKCYRGKPLCAIDHGEWGGPNSCASRLCECDQALSRCLRRYHCPKKRAVCTSNPVRLLQNLIMVL